MMMKKILKLALVMGLCWSGASYAQFAAPICDPRVADSTCFSAPTGATCTMQPAAAMQACPNGYSGQGEQLGSRNSCTGEVTWDASTQNKSACTNCPTNISNAEIMAMQNAILGQLSEGNQRFTDWACPNCIDGTMIKNPVNNLQTGRAFRGRVWVPDAFPTNSLPSGNRINYLAQMNRLPAIMPSIAGLKTNYTQDLYLQALKGAATVSSCSGNDMSHCDLSCAAAPSGWLDKYCATQTLSFNNGGCSDSWEVLTPSGYRPTKDANVPYTAANNFTVKTWPWPTILAWNNSSSTAYMCNSTINYCTGWQTQNSWSVCVSTYYQQYYDQYGVPTYGAWICNGYDTMVTQYNDCTGGSRTNYIGSIYPAKCR